MADPYDPRARLDVAAWEENYLRMERGLGPRVRRLRRFALPAQGRLLDLGCGDGLEIAALRQAGAGGMLVAIDISLNLARRVRGVPVVVADAGKLPFRDGSFALVYANNVLHHLDLPAFRGELVRVTAADGGLAFVEPQPSWFRTLVDIFCWSPLARPFSVLRARGIDVRQEVPEYYRWMAGIDEWLASLRLAGFTPRVLRRGLFRIYVQVEKERV